MGEGEGGGDRAPSEIFYLTRWVVRKQACAQTTMNQRANTYQKGTGTGDALCGTEVSYKRFEECGDSV